LEHDMTDRKTDSSVPPEDATSESEIERLLHKASYTPRELAELLDVPVSLIEQDAFAGRLHADIVEHDIIGISRAAAIDWLNNRR
jgi:hypothetical protein